MEIMIRIQTTSTGHSSPLLLLAACFFLTAGCPLSKATYVLRSSGNDWMRIGPAVDGETIFKFILPAGTRFVPMSQVMDRIEIERFDSQRKPMPAKWDDAPVYIRISGLAQISDAPDGEWRLAWCSR